jgi:hypothetical protein
MENSCRISRVRRENEGVLVDEHRHYDAANRFSDGVSY